VKRRRRSVAQATRLDSRLGAHKPRFLPLLLRQELRRRFPPGTHELAGLLEFGARPIVVRHFESHRRLVPERLHLRVTHLEPADLLEQTGVLSGDLGEAIGKLLARDWRLAENSEEAGYGFSAEPTVCRDERVQPGDQGLSVAGLRRGGETY
jgi:hypothetical protein